MTSVVNSLGREADRKRLLAQICELGKNLGCQVSWSSNDIYPGPRALSVRTHAPGGLCVNIVLDGKRAKDSLLLSWHLDGQAISRLNTAVFPDVNPYHGRKATEVVAISQVLGVLKTRWEAAANGSAFLPEKCLA